MQEAGCGMRDAGGGRRERGRASGQQAALRGVRQCRPRRVAASRNWLQKPHDAAAPLRPLRAHLAEERGGGAPASAPTPARGPPRRSSWEPGAPSIASVPRRRARRLVPPPPALPAPGGSSAKAPGQRQRGAPGSRGAEPPLPGPRPSPGRAGALPAGGGAGDARTRTKPRRPRAAPRASSGRRRARPHRSSAAREEEKQQPPHSSGRATGERGELELPRFPQLQTAGRGNDAARGALPASTATRKSGREGRPRGHAPAPLPPRRLAGAPPIAGARRRARGDAGARARRPGTPGGCLATATPSASPEVSDDGAREQVCEGNSSPHNLRGANYIKI